MGDTGVSRLQALAYRNFSRRTTPNRQKTAPIRHKCVLEDSLQIIRKQVPFSSHRMDVQFVFRRVRQTCVIDFGETCCYND